jgi:hypothetical protein
VRAQSPWFRRADPGDALFFQVGRFNAFDAPADDALAQGLGLRQLRANRRRARYPDFDDSAVFPRQAIDSSFSEEQGRHYRL